jgi:hypothetical protein
MPNVYVPNIVLVTEFIEEIKVLHIDSFLEAAE